MGICFGIAAIITALAHLVKAVAKLIEAVKDED